MAATFDFRDAEGASLGDVARLDTMATVVDAANLLADFGSRDLLRDRGQRRDEGDERTLVELLVDQIEFADVIVLNKVSAAGPERTAEARRVVRSLNPTARLIEADFCDVPLSSVLRTGLFDFERARCNPLWFRELHGFADHRPETEEYGIASFVYRAPASVPPGATTPTAHGAAAWCDAGQGPFLDRDPADLGAGVQPRRCYDRHQALWPLVGGHAAERLAARSGRARADPPRLARALRRPPPGAGLHRHRPRPRQIAPRSTPALSAAPRGRPESAAA